MSFGFLIMFSIVMKSPALVIFCYSLLEFLRHMGTVLYIVFAKIHFLFLVI